ncbi:Nucleolar protein 14 [Macleaya cordata]|uniref:Nucleolar protein 14 n=1 Tax=Macleaya cordata TaxID=56857 RepID=A0A200PQY2_MACCD|nr:Nucleolar protein 14 [Macleaya cordata]
MRIGEQNDELGEFDKAILRFQRERQLKLNVESKYNLSDGEEDDYTNHGGGYFLEGDDFEDDDMSPDGDETKKKSAILKQLGTHYAQNPLESWLMERDENKQKGKKEVMGEIILKRKIFKALKAKDKEENEHLVEELDQNFTSLVQSKSLISLTQLGKMDALKSLWNKGDSKESMRQHEPSLAKNEPPKQEQPDAYDKLVKEMSLDMRARPSDRMKTPAEIDQEEREWLEQLEEERQKRMLGMDDSGDGHEDFKNASSQKLRSISGDDLGDSFSLDEEVGNKRSWVDKILEREDHSIQVEDSASSENSDEDIDGDEDESDDDNDELGKIMSLKDWEQSDDDNLTTYLEEEEEDGEEEETEGNDTRKLEDYIKPKTKNQIADPSTVMKPCSSVKQPPTNLKAIPFVIESPNSMVELCSLLEHRSDADIIEVIHRIHACNGVRLAAENRKKMQVFYGILLQYFAVLATKKPLNFKLLNFLVKPLVEMSFDTPYYAAICAHHRICRTRTQFCEQIRNPENSCWPSLKTLFLLRLWSIIFPCSDFRHIVMTPAILLMCEYLRRCPITSGRDICIGSFLCSMVLSVIRQSQKFCPEALEFLRTVLMSALEKGESLYHHSQQVYYCSELKMAKPWLQIRDHVSEIHPLDFLSVMSMTEDSPFFTSDNFRASVLVSVIETLRGFVHIYEGYDSFPEIFSPISTLLHKLKQANMPDLLHDRIEDVAQLIGKKTDEHHLLRQPLQMLRQEPVQNEQLIPKFEENFVKGRDYDPDRKRAERKKLMRLKKREAKGAASELRKDSHFLFGLKEKDKERLEEERAETLRKTKVSLLQEHEFGLKSRLKDDRRIRRKRC